MQPLFCGMHAELSENPIDDLHDWPAYVGVVSFMETTNRVGVYIFSLA